MEPSRFRALACEVFGYWGYQRALARKHEVPQVTVRRWCMGEMAIPPQVIESLLDDATKKIGTVAQLVRG